MRYFNYLVIVLVLVVSALLGRGYLRGQDPLPALQADLARCLDAFWQNQGSRVEVLEGPTQTEVRASVAFPPGTGARQQQWMYPFIAFVARRHAGVKLGSVRVVPLAETQAAQEAESNVRPGQYHDATRAEALQRELQARLDASLGAGQALILVDAQSSPLAVSRQRVAVSKDRVSPLESAPALAPPPDDGGAPARMARPRAPYSPGEPAPAPAPLQGCLVLQPQTPSNQASELVRPSLGQVRVLVLP